MSLGKQILRGIFGPSSATDEGVMRWDGASGKVAQNTASVTINDDGDMQMFSDLTLDDNDNEQRILLFRRDGADVGKIGTYGGIFSIKALNNENFRLLDTSNNIGLYLKDGGDVGIGTESPTERLHVQENINSSLNIFFENPSGGGGAQARLKMTTRDSGEGYIGIADPSNVIEYVANRFYIAAQSNFTDGISLQVGTGDDIRFYINAVEKFRLDADGNVGIGTPSPTQLLDVNAKAGMSAIGGKLIKLTNKTGGASVAGNTVNASSITVDAVEATEASSLQSIGVFLESGVADGAEAWIVHGGIADVHMDAGGCALGDRIITSATKGRGLVSNAPAVAVHFQEIGHAIEVAAANGNARIVMHHL